MHEATCNAAGDHAAARAPETLPIEKTQVFGRSRLGRRAAAFSCKVMGYAGIGMAALEANTRVAYAQSLNITNINSIFSFVGMAITVVGAALAGWNLVQVGMSMKDSQGFQMDKNVWGVVGGVAMVVAGQVFNQAANMWRV